MVATAIQTDIIRPQPGPQEDFLSCGADIAIYGGAAGSGKTFAELLEPLRYTLAVPGFNTLILRRTTKEVRNVGGLWTEAESLYPNFGARAKVGDLLMEFPNGNPIKFDHMEHEHDKFRYQGSQIALIEFDELTHFTEAQFWYMLSRNRSTCGVKPYIRCTCNPDAASWVAKFIEWWIDPKTGYPIPERSGVWRWFVRRGGVLTWGATREELLELYPESTPKSLTFIAATLDDNPALTSRDPAYRANLEALPHVEQERLLKGNWKIVDTEGAEWPAEYFETIWADDWPDAFEMSAVAVDPSKGKEKGDYSAIVFAGLCGGKIWIDADIERRPVPEIIEATAEMVLAYDAWQAAFESNGFQELLAPEFERYCVENRIPPIPVALLNNYAVKERRIRRLGGWLKGDKFRFRRGSPGCQLLLQQLMQFPIGDHDDGPDALEMAVRILNELAALEAREREHAEY